MIRRDKDKSSELGDMAKQLAIWLDNLGAEVSLQRHQNKVWIYASIPDSARFKFTIQLAPQEANNGNRTA